MCALDYPVQNSVELIKVHIITMLGDVIYAAFRTPALHDSSLEPLSMKC